MLRLQKKEQNNDFSVEAVQRNQYKIKTQRGVPWNFFRFLTFKNGRRNSYRTTFGCRSPPPSIAAAAAPPEDMVLGWSSFVATTPLGPEGRIRNGATTDDCDDGLVVNNPTTPPLDDKVVPARRRQFNDSNNVDGVALHVAMN